MFTMFAARVNFPKPFLPHANIDVMFASPAAVVVS